MWLCAAGTCYSKLIGTRDRETLPSTQPKTRTTIPLVRNRSCVSGFAWDQASFSLGSGAALSVLRYSDCTCARRCAMRMRFIGVMLEGIALHVTE